MTIVKKHYSAHKVVVSVNCHLPQTNCFIIIFKMLGRWKKRSLLFFLFFYQIQLSAHMLHHLRSRKLERRNVWQHNFTKHRHAIISFSLNLFFSFIYFIVFWKTNRAITVVPFQVIYPCCRVMLYSLGFNLGWLASAQVGCHPIKIGGSYYVGDN